MKILVADDSRTMRRVFRTLLESMGHSPGDIYEANDAIEALSVLKIRKYEIDYIIADFDMAGMENHGFLHSIKKDAPKPIPVLVCINANQRLVAAESIRHGATMLLERPFRDIDARQKVQAIEAGLKAKKAEEATQYLKAIAATAEAEIDLPFLMQLPSLIMKEFLQLSGRTTYEAGEAIFRAGDPVDALYVVTLGEVEMVPTQGAAEMIREGETFGELAFMSGERSTATARAHSLSQIVALPRHRLAELISHQPRMSHHLSAMVARRSKQVAKPPPQPANTEFSGNLNSMSFADVLQLLQIGRKNGVVMLDLGGRKGEIGLEGGEVRTAIIVGGASGEEAFYQLAAWKNASFGFVSGRLKGEPNISTPTMPLLMEAMRRVDESSRSTNRRVADSSEKPLSEMF